MKGEIVDGTKDPVLDLDEHVETVWKALDDGLTIEIAWEALNLIELYFSLRIIGHILLTAEYVLVEIKTNPLALIEREFVQLKKVTDGFFEKGKSWLWQIFEMYRISGTGISMLRQLRTENKKDTGLYGNFVAESNSKLTHPMFSHITETLTSSYCC